MDNNILTLEINPITNPKFKIYNTKTDKIHSCNSKTALRNYLRITFNIKNASLTNILVSLLQNKCIKSDHSDECIGKYLSTSIQDINSNLQSTKQPRPTLQVPQPLNDTRTRSEYSSWVSQEMLYQSNSLITTDMHDLNDKLENMSLIISVLKNDNIQLHKDNKALHERLDKIDAADMTSRVNEMVEITRRVTAIQEASESISTIIPEVAETNLHKILSKLLRPI